MLAITETRDQRFQKTSSAKTLEKVVTLSSTSAMLPWHIAPYEEKILLIPRRALSGGLCSLYVGSGGFNPQIRLTVCSVSKRCAPYSHFGQPIPN